MVSAELMPIQELPLAEGVGVGVGVGAAGVNPTENPEAVPDMKQRLYELAYNVWPVIVVAVVVTPATAGADALSNEVEHDSVVRIKSEFDIADTPPNVIVPDATVPPAAVTRAVMLEEIDPDPAAPAETVGADTVTVTDAPGATVGKAMLKPPDALKKHKL